MLKARSRLWLTGVLVAVGHLVALSARGEDQSSVAGPQTESPYAIEGDSVGSLIGGIRLLRVRESRLSGTTRQERITDFVHLQDAIIDAAQRVLEAAEADEAQAATAVGEKFTALDNLRRLDQPEAVERIEQAIETYLKDSREKVAAAARSFRLKQRFAKFEELSNAQREQAVEELLQEVAASEPTTDTLRTAREIGRQIERADAELAARVYRAFADRFAKGDDPRVRDYAETFTGTARRLELPGQFMEIEGATVDGQPFDWDSYRGKVVLVDFWATWCGPCRAELPNLKRNYERYHERGFDVVGVSLDKDREALETFLKDEQIPWVTLYSDDSQANGWDLPLARHYGISAIPAVLLVDREGRVVHLNARGDALGEELARLLGPVEEPE